MFKERPACNNSLSSRKLVFGVGINDSKYITKYKCNGKWVRCPFYKVWFHMLQRCYDDKFQERSPSYIGCYVDDDWLVFSNFRLWMLKQDWKGNQLDKDFLAFSGSGYSKDSCIFVNLKLNSAISFVRKGKRNLKLGVTMSTRTNNYEANCCKDGKKVYIGTYKTEDEAHNEYRKIKREVLINYASGHSKKIREAVTNFVIPEY